MSRHRGLVTLFSIVTALHAASPAMARQVRAAPGGARPPAATTAPREALLLNWAEIPVSEFSLGGGPPGSMQPFRLFTLEAVEGSQHWVERAYHWDASGQPVVDDTKVYPAGVRIVQAVTGYSQSLGGTCGWYGCPTVKLALLLPIASAAPGAPLRARRAAPFNTRANPAALYRIPVAQAMGYQRVPPAQPRHAPPEVCPASTAFSSSGAPLQASCVLLEPGQAVDLPNQIRILRVGGNYRIIVAGSLVDDLADVTIVRGGDGRYYALQSMGTY